MRSGTCVFKTSKCRLRILPSPTRLSAEISVFLFLPHATTHVNGTAHRRRIGFAVTPESDSVSYFPFFLSHIIRVIYTCSRSVEINFLTAVALVYGSRRRRDLPAIWSTNAGSGNHVIRIIWSLNVVAYVRLTVGQHERHIAFSCRLLPGQSFFSLSLSAVFKNHN